MLALINVVLKQLAGRVMRSLRFLLYGLRMLLKELFLTYSFFFPNIHSLNSSVRQSSRQEGVF